MANFVFRSTITEIDKYDGVLLLNEHSDLYFLLHNFVAQIIPFKSKNCFYNLSEGKDIAKIVQRPPYYDLKNNDSRNVLSRCR